MVITQLRQKQKKPFFIKIIVEANSGKDVPNATANSDKKTVEKPKIAAVFNKEEISNLAENISPTKDIINKKSGAISDWLFVCCKSVGEFKDGFL